MIFRFKQFEVKHSDSLLKVNTDAVLLGSLMHSEEPVHSALDIGTGCGIIALMAAQKFTNATFNALEIDPPSFAEAEFNFMHSPFSERTKCFPVSLQNFESGKKYDLIFSNPPYFETPDFSKGNNLQNIKEHRKKSATQFTLTFEELVINASRLLNPGGKFWVIIPTISRNNFLRIAEINNLFLYEDISIRSKPSGAIIRSVLCFGFINCSSAKSSKLSLYNHDGSRHNEYVEITNDYYL